MATVLYGPWRVLLTSANSHFAQRLVISGSDNADGAYDVAYGTPLDLHVQGTEWRIQTEFYPFGGPAWTAGDIRRSTRFELQQGLIVQLDGAARPPGTGGTTFNNLTLICTCLDPETNPIPSGNPYDFTIPDHG